MPEAPGNDTGDAIRRTRLANERTYLAWWRTGLTSLAVGLGAGRLVPELSTGSTWPFEIVGSAFALVGVGLIAYSYIRQKQVEEAVSRGEYAPLAPGASFAFAAVGVLLGLGTIAIILIEGR